VDTQFLHTFVAVVDHGSMAAAARLLNITPAAVAQQIRTLEREIGAPLIARAGRTVSVTEAGSRILERARELLRHVADLSAIATDSSTAGELRLGAGTNALTGLVPDILARLVELHPRLKVFIRPGYSPELYRAVEAGDLDAAVVLEAPFPLPKTCGWELLREEELVVLAPRRWAGRDPHELLQTEPLVRYDRTQWGGRVAEQYLQRAGIVPQERFELSSLLAIAMMVDRGLGVSVVPDIASPLLDGQRIVKIPLPLPSETRRFGILWMRSSPRLRLIHGFVESAALVTAAKGEGGGSCKR